MTPKEALKEIKARHESLYDRYYNTEKYHFNENNKFLYDDLEKALDETISLKLTNVSLVSVNTDLVKEMREVRKENESLKKPPTVEEVCGAFTSWIKEQGKYASMFISVEYNEKTKTFWIKKTYGEFHYLSTLDGMGQLDIANNHYPPHLITMIGRFYEGLEK